jgi:baseplate hub protein gp41
VQELDPRLVTLSINVNGVTNTFQDLYIKANGTKYSNPLQNECEATIYNLDKQTQDYLLSETSPYNANKTQKTLTLQAGRQSYGLSKIYVGNIVFASPTQPPDIGITFKCLESNFLKGQFSTLTQPGVATLSQVAKQAAAALNVTLLNQATDKNVTNASYSGPTGNLVNHVQSFGGVNCYIDNGVLVVKNANVPLSGTVRVLSATSGMIGIPTMTERGLRVTFLLDNTTVLGGGLQIQSVEYPAINGNYIIYKLGFQIANRETPFYWIAEALRSSSS